MMKGTGKGSRPVRPSAKETRRLMIVSILRRHYSWFGLALAWLGRQSCEREQEGESPLRAVVELLLCERTKVGRGR